MFLYTTSNVTTAILYHFICWLWGWMDCTIRLNSAKRLDWLQNHSEHNDMRLGGLHNQAEQWQEAGLAAEPFWTQWCDAGWTGQSGWKVARVWTGCRTILNTMLWGWMDCTIRLNSAKGLDWLQNHSEHNDMRLGGLNNQAEQWQEAELAAEPFWTQWYEARWTAHSACTVARGWIGCRTILNTMVWGWMECRTRLNSDKRLDWLQNHSEHNGVRLDGLHNQAEEWQEAGLASEPFWTQWYEAGLNVEQG